MRLDHCDQQVRVIRPPIIDLVVGDDLMALKAFERRVLGVGFCVMSTYLVSL